MEVNQDRIKIGTISGGIVNFGGAVYISPISVTITNSGAGSGNRGEDVTTTSGSSSAIQQSVPDIIELIRRSLQ